MARVTFKNARPEVAAVPLLSALQAAPGLAVGLAAGIGAGALHALTGPDHLATLAPLSLDAESAQPRGGLACRRRVGRSASSRRQPVAGC